MMIPRKDGSLVYYPVERSVTLNPEVIVRECALPSGDKIVMHCQYGEKIMVIDSVAYAAALKTEVEMPIDVWFAWYPVRLGALGTGRLVWLRRVLRIGTGQATIYQPVEWY